MAGGFPLATVAPFSRPRESDPLRHGESMSETSTFEVGDFFSQWGLVTLVYRDKANWTWPQLDLWQKTHGVYGSQSESARPSPFQSGAQVPIQTRMTHQIPSVTRHLPHPAAEFSAWFACKLRADRKSRPRGFVHFASKEGAMRVLEESTALRALSAGKTQETKHGSSVRVPGSITFHRRKLDIKAGRRNWFSGARRSPEPARKPRSRRRL